ncbi:MAG TPA: alkaline phosphatase family protein [Longimicrobiaceae bacterium]|nr:alkaline phosphatase family protein [Longimicrobiaceae bacterium]
MPAAVPGGARRVDSALTRRPGSMPHAPDTQLPQRAILVFLDGIGIGADTPQNPFATARLPTLERMLGGRRPLAEHLDADGAIHGPDAVLVAADATLGIAGMPQSGTGQTSLLTGRNGAAMYGRHFGPWVPTPLREMLGAENLLSRALHAGRRPAFANAYPIASIDADPRIFRRPAGPPLAARAAGCLTRDLADLAGGRAVASSITNEMWRRHVGADLPQVTPEEAGRRLARIAADADVTLFAHYDTDHAGHRGSDGDGVAALEKVDAFLSGVMDALPADALLVVASDHGNLEDPSPAHTLNPVPVIAAGPGRHALAARVRDLTHVTPAILHLLGIRAGGEGTTNDLNERVDT